MWYIVKLVMPPDSKEEVADGSRSHLRGLMKISFDSVHLPTVTSSLWHQRYNRK